MLDLRGTSSLSLCLTLRKLICLVSDIYIEHMQFQQAKIAKKLLRCKICDLITSTS